MTTTAGARAVGGAGIGPALASGMTDREREHDNDTGPIDESSYGGSSAETGGLYDDSGPTRGNVEGDTMSEAEERGGRPPEEPSGG